MSSPGSSVEGSLKTGLDSLGAASPEVKTTEKHAKLYVALALVLAVVGIAGIVAASSSATGGGRIPSSDSANRASCRSVGPDSDSRPSVYLDDDLPPGFRDRYFLISSQPEASFDV